MKVQIARWLSLGSYLGLIAFGLAWAIWLGDVPAQQKSLSMLFFAPLLLPLRGILHAREKAVVWGTLVSLIYLVDGGMTWYADSARWFWGALELLLAVTFMVFGSFFLRWRAQARAAQ